jgi:hypothetical protein
MFRRILAILLILLACLIVICIAVPLIFLRGEHTNPPVMAEPQWDSLRTRELFFRACGDCHSNETVWPWYSNVPPVSVLIQNDTLEGRAQFNVSEWGRPENEGGESAELLQSGEMPPRMYLLMHPSASLNASEKQELLQGLIATFGGEGGEGGEGEEGD